MMKPLFFLALFGLIALRPAVGYAQIPATAGPALSAAQAQQALDVLQDPRKREQLISTLQAIAKAAPALALPAPATEAPAAAAPEAAKTTPTVTLKPNSLGAQLLVALLGGAFVLRREAAATLQTMEQPCRMLWRWFIDGLETGPCSVLPRW